MPIVLGALAAVVACGRIGFDPVGGTPNTRIDAAIDAVGQPPADTCTLGPWTMPADQPFASVNSADTDWGVEISRDGLRLVFSSNRPDPLQQVRNYDLYMAERRSTADPFDPPVRLSISSDGRDDSDPSLSDDAVELYFVSARNPSICMYVSSRGSLAAPWGAPRRLDPLCQAGDLGGPFLSRDGLRLYYDVSVSGSSQLYMASRTTRTTDFASAGIAIGAPGLRYCALDDGELTAYCENGDLANAQLWQATRASTDAPFSAGQPIQELGDLGMFEDGDPSLTSDGLHLIYASSRPRDASGPSDLFIAERSCP